MTQSTIKRSVVARPAAAAPVSPSAKPGIKVVTPSAQQPPSAGKPAAAKASVLPPRPGATPAAVVQVAPNARQSSDPVSRFIELEMEARKCRDLDSLRFAVVNSPRQIAQFEQAFLAEPTAIGQWTVTLASSVAKVDRHSNLMRGLDAWLQHPEHANLIARAEPRLAALDVEARQWGLNARLFALSHAFWLPIKGPDGQQVAALILLKSENWRPQHTALMIPLADAYGHAWRGLAPNANSGVATVRRYLTRSRTMATASAIALLAAFIPVPMSALAPAEIVAVQPMLVTAPIDGVIGEILAAPGAWVEQGAPIVRFVDVKLRNDAEIAGRNVMVAKAKHFKLVQSATLTQKDMQDLATAQAEAEVAQAEYAYARVLLERSVIRAERAGLLVYSSKSDWVGKPVSIGERIMEIGDPGKAEIKIELPVSDAIALKHGGAVSLFLDGDPLRAIGATITRSAYRPTMTTDQQLSFRIHAAFDDSTPRRLGLRGVARVSGETVSLWFYLLRRPLSALRQRIGY